MADKEKLLRSRPWIRQPDPDDSVQHLKPELADIKRNAEKFNTRVRNELGSIQPPSDLRDRILTGRKIVPVSSWQRKWLPLAAAVAFLAVGLLYWLYPREDHSIAGFRSRVVGFALREYRMDLLTDDLTQLKQFLAQNGRPSNFALPAKLASTQLKGGASLSWQDKRVSMVCFDWGGGETLYMFVLPEDHPEFREPRIERVKKLATATWTSGNATFVLAGKLSEEELRSLIKP